MEYRYCYGGSVALGVATQPDLVDVVVACHAGPVDIAEVGRAVTPLLMISTEGTLLPLFRLSPLWHHLDQTHLFPTHKWTRHLIELTRNRLEDVWLPPPKRDQAEAALKRNTVVETKMEYFPGEAGF